MVTKETCGSVLPYSPMMAESEERTKRGRVKRAKFTFPAGVRMILSSPSDKRSTAPRPRAESAIRAPPPDSKISKNGRRQNQRGNVSYGASLFRHDVRPSSFLKVDI